MKRACSLTMISLWLVWISRLEVTAQELRDGDTTEGGPPPCASAAELSFLSGTIVYEGDPVEGEDPERSFDIWVIGAPDWTPKLVAGGPGCDVFVVRRFG